MLARASSERSIRPRKKEPDSERGEFFVNTGPAAINGVYRVQGQSSHFFV